MIPHTPNTSKTVLFACPNCAFTFVVDRAYHGSRAICRGCEQSVLVNLNEREEAAEPNEPVADRPTEQPLPFAPPKASQGAGCKKCGGRARNEFVAKSEIWWADEQGNSLSPLTFIESASRSRRCIACGFIEFQPSDWLAPHDEAGFHYSPTKEGECESCGGYCEAGLLTNSAGEPASIYCAPGIDAFETFRVNAGHVNVPVSATHCFQCGKVSFVGRKWVNEEGFGGANLLGERPL